MRGGAVAAIVGGFGLGEAGGAFAGFLPGEVAEAVIFAFGIVGGVVVEGWVWMGLVVGASSIGMRREGKSSPPPPSCVAAKDIVGLRLMCLIS